MQKKSLAIVLLCVALFSPQVFAAKAIFAGGCFWCIESDFQDIPGVLSAVSGYTGGKGDNPTYKQVTYGNTGHYEAVEITYDEKKISYQQLLDLFWVNIDPFDARGQFCDKGPSYLSAIFVLDDQQRQLAEASKAQRQNQLGEDKPIVTPILAASKFWPAEDYHQDYYKTNPIRYKLYRFNCGRDARLDAVWGKDRKSQ